MSTLFRSFTDSTWDKARAAQAFRHIAIIGIAGIVTGVLVGGIGGRVFMRISAVIADDSAMGAVTENGNVVGDITLSGTIGLIIAVGVFFGIYGAVIYVISEPWLTWTGPLRGVAFGVFLLATASVAAIDPENPDFSLLGDDPRNVIMLAALFLLFGPVLVGVINVLDARLPAPRSDNPLRSSAAYIVIVALGVPFLIQLVLVLTTPTMCGCHSPPVLIGVFVVLLTVATTVYWISKMRELNQPLNLWIKIVGYASITGAFIAGALRAAADIGQLL